MCRRPAVCRKGVHLRSGGLGGCCCSNSIEHPVSCRVGSITFRALEKEHLLLQQASANLCPSLESFAAAWLAEYLV